MKHSKSKLLTATLVVSSIVLLTNLPIISSIAYAILLIIAIANITARHLGLKADSVYCSTHIYTLIGVVFMSSLISGNVLLWLLYLYIGLIRVYYNDKS